MHIEYSRREDRNGYVIITGRATCQADYLVTREMLKEAKTPDELADYVHNKLKRDIVHEIYGEAREAAVRLFDLAQRASMQSHPDYKTHLEIEEVGQKLLRLLDCEDAAP